MNNEKGFDIIEENSNKKLIFIGAGVVGLLVVAAVLFFVLKSDPKPAPKPPAPQAQTKAAQTAKPAGRQDIKVVAKDPAAQAQVDQQMQEFLHYIQNPTIDDAVITVEWLSRKFNQPPAVIVKDVKVLTGRLSGLSDEQLAAFFAGSENPWQDDPAYNNLIKLITHREYVSFVSKCVDIYAREKLGAN
ncbi:hypothetical protein LJB99_06305 [Deltaproteobacteria bacterium OttesenSCG-928-K17]|nr:hypothetical protein [Deltaproteobacteria bacterium OttesenSCG-928-K17]